MDINKGKQVKENLFDVNPMLAKEWHPSKNGDFTPDMVTSHSNKIVWWLCDKGHEWQATINNRSNGTGCPFCSNRAVWVGFNDLATVNPALAKEWHPSKNGDLTPNMVTSYSNKKIWWLCDKGHEWQAVISSRSSGRNCPFCSNQAVLSGYNDLATVNPALAKEWHPSKNGDLTPNKVTSYSSKKIWWLCDKGHEWQAVISSRSSGANCPFCSNRAVLSGYNDLATVNPALAKEWHPTKNGDLTPNTVTPSAKAKVWWLCDKGHEWQATVNHRSSNTGCPFCSSRAVWVGYNDLATINPTLAKEWHPTKNGDLTPNMVSSKSNKKVWWQCEKGHEWQAVISSRIVGANCPFCSNQAVLSGYNDLATINPTLAKEWHPAKNGDLTPNTVTPSAKAKVWWLCDKGHEWQATVNDRARGHGCPVCSSELRTSFAEQAIFYYLKQCFPDAINGDREILDGLELDVFIPSINVAVEYDGNLWHKNINRDKKKNALCNQLGIKLVRIREKELPVIPDCDCIIRTDESNTSLDNAIKDLLNALDVKYPFTICSSDIRIEIMNEYISGEKVNSLANTYPDIANEWNYTKNGTLTPNMVSPQSNKKVWWRCEKGHEWQASADHRTNGRGCPICSNKRVLEGYNDLATVNPEIALEWHPTKNGELNPNMVVFGSGKMVWWICEKGHEWQARVVDRVKGQKCPKCHNLH